MCLCQSDCVYRNVWAYSPLWLGKLEVYTHKYIHHTEVQMHANRHTVEDTEIQIYRNRHTCYTHTHPCLEAFLGPAQGWPYIGLTSRRKAGSPVWGKLVGMDSRGFPSLDWNVFLCPSRGCEPAPPSAFHFHLGGHTSDSRTAGWPCRLIVLENTEVMGPWKRNSYPAVFLFRQHTSNSTVSSYSILEPL